MNYKVLLGSRAQQHLKEMKRANPSAFRKTMGLVDELITHPRSGTGHPEQLRNCTRETWSRRITKKDRLVYVIEDEVVTVTVVSAIGHYGDK